MTEVSVGGAGIEITQREGVTVVRLNRPPVNALDLELLEEIVAAFGDIAGPVVVTGTARCFCAGVDLKAILDGDADYTGRFLTALSQAFLAVFDHPGPVVAALNGHAIAGGCVNRDGGRRALHVRRHDRHIRGRGRRAVPDSRAGDLPLRDGRERGRGRAVRRRDQRRNGAGPGLGGRGRRTGVVARSRGPARRRARGALPSAYAATKEQLHRPARAAMDNDAYEARVRAEWSSSQTRERIESYVANLDR